MGDRGRKSAASLAVVKPEGQVVPRPQPPTDLTPEQAHEWRAITNGMAATAFPRETHAMLGAYCRHTVSLRRVAELIQIAESADEFDVVKYDRLLKMQERESRCIASLAVRLGMAQTTANDQNKKPAASNPWEYKG